MDVKLRKCIMGAGSFGALVLVFAIYLHFNGSAIPPGRDRVEPDLSGLDDDSGQSIMLGGTKVIVLKDFSTDERDVSGRRLRRWGFEELRGQAANVVEVSQPFMTLYHRSDLTCDITAQQGYITLRTDQRDLIPKDFVFSGSVVIHIVPAPDSDWEEIQIFLDDISFVSDTSVCSSSGPIKLVSDSVKLDGQGVEFVYSKLAQRIQYFKLAELLQLRIRAPEDKLFPDANDLSNSEPDAPGTRIVDAGPGPSQADQAQQGQYYECALYQAVVVRTPKELVFARDRLRLTNIFRPKPPPDVAQGQSDRNVPVDPVPAVDDPNLDPIPAAELVDVTITCGNGLLLLPQDAPYEINPAPVPPESIISDPNTPKGPSHAGFVSQALTHDLLKRDTHAKGPLELIFYAEEVNAPTPLESLVPIKVTAQDYGTYETQPGHVLLQGDCRCTLLRQDPNVTYHHALEAQAIGLDLAENKDGQTIAARRDLKHMEAYGGTVRLGIYTRARPEVNEPGLLELQSADLLAGAEIECQRVEYDPNAGQARRRQGYEGQGVFTATGPGIIWFNNTKTRSTDSVGPQDKPCYAYLDNFETLQYFVAENRIVAHAQGNHMQFKYFPRENGKTGPAIHAQTKSVDIELFKTHAGDLDLSRLTATGDIHCKDSASGMTFTGDGVAYDHRQASLRLWSDTDKPCTVNGLPFEGSILYNLETGEGNFDISGPGVISVPKVGQE